MPLTSRRSKTWYWNVPVRWVTFGEQSRVISRERRRRSISPHTTGAAEVAVTTLQSTS